MSDPPFLERWSKRKREAKAAAVEPPPDLPAEPPPPPPLPDITSLGKDSDYSGFLRAGVPAELRQQALDRLWASDPVLMAPDPLDLHTLDYNTPAGSEVVKTAWRLGKGVLDAAELAEETDAAKDTNV